MATDLQGQILAQQLMRRQQRQSPSSAMAARLMQQASDTSPTTAIGGVARALTGALAGYQARRADEDDRAETDSLTERLLQRERDQQAEAAAWAGMFAGGRPPALAPAPQMPSEMPAPASVNREPLPPLPGVPQRGEAPPAVAGGIAARAALDPNAPDYAERIMLINDSVVRQTMPGQMPRPMPVAMAQPQMPQEAPPRPGGMPQFDVAQLVAGLGSPNPLIRERAASLMPLAQAQIAQGNRTFPMQELDGPQGPGVYEMRPDGPRLVGRPLATAPLPPETEQQRLRLAAAGRPSVEVRTGQTFGEALGRNTAEQLQALQADARTGAETIQSAQRVRSLLDGGAITGTLAESRLGIERALASAGLIDGRRVTNTEQLMAELANGVLAKSSQMSGVLTDRDIAFLREASAGNIALTAQTIRQITELAERGAGRLIERYNSAVEPLLTAPDVPEVTRRIYQPIRPAGQPAPGARVRVTSPAEAQQLAPGTEYETPDGQVFRR